QGYLRGAVRQRDYAAAFGRTAAHVPGGGEAAQWRPESSAVGGLRTPARYSLPGGCHRPRGFICAALSPHRRCCRHAWDPCLRRHRSGGCDPDNFAHVDFTATKQGRPASPRVLVPLEAGGGYAGDKPRAPAGPGGVTFAAVPLLSRSKLLV